MKKIDYGKVSAIMAKEYGELRAPTFIKQAHLGNVASKGVKNLAEKIIMEHSDVYEIDWIQVSKAVYAKLGKVYQPAYLVKVHKGKFQSAELSALIKKLIK
jgi:hypothetical protein